MSVTRNIVVIANAHRVIAATGKIQSGDNTHNQLRLKTLAIFSPAKMAVSNDISNVQSIVVSIMV